MKSISNTLRLFTVAIVFMVSTAATISAQENPSSDKAYIYCSVTFNDFKVQKEKQIHNYTQKYTERVYKMSVDCRQYDDDLPYPTSYRSDMNLDQVYWFRMDVSGLSADQINAKLAPLRPSKE